MLEVRTPYRDHLLARLAAEDGFEVMVLYLTDKEPLRHWRLDDAPYQVRTLPGLAGGGRAGGFNVKLNPSVGRVLSAFSPDVVLLGGYAVPTNQLAMLWCRWHRVPYLLMWESHDLDERPAARRLLTWVPSALALRGAAGALPASSMAHARLVRSGMAPERLHILPNAPDVRAIAAAVRRPEQPAGRPPRFLFSGRLVTTKDVPTLIEAFARTQQALPDAELVIVGSGPLEDELKTLVERLGLHGVTFQGFVQPAEMLGLYATADVFVLPSRQEPFGVVVMEAMAAGLSVIVSDRVGCAFDLVDPSCGTVFPVGDVNRLACEMIAFGTDERRRAEVGREAARAVMKWDIEYCVATVQRAMRNALRVPSGTTRAS